MQYQYFLFYLLEKLFDIIKTLKNMNLKVYIFTETDLQLIKKRFS